ncbi:hypothetical protein [Hugenholtzia roseola]|uniref:hypothetical protein n=1 Tax=Hugenholtzia roseola TaxID=1002 RepID=UPI00041A9BBA|nr:hypothetical protein [Hugenholtzia roseola]
MKKLPRGITGFAPSESKSTNKSPNPTTIVSATWQDFERSALLVSRWQLLELYQQMPPFNFHFALFERDKRQMGVLCHRDFALVAFVNLPLHKQAYTEGEDLTLIFERFFEVLPADFLRLRPNADHPDSVFSLQNLADEEFAQMAYFQPENIGQIIFNNWQK